MRNRKRYCTFHPVYVHVNSNVELGTVVLCYAYLYPMMAHMYGEFKGENVILETNKEDHCHKIPFLSVSMQDESCVLLSI